MSNISSAQKKLAVTNSKDANLDIPGLVYESSGIAAFFWIIHDFSTNNLSSIPNLMIIDINNICSIFEFRKKFNQLTEQIRCEFTRIHLLSVTRNNLYFVNYQ